LKVFDQMRLEAVGLPHLEHRGIRDAQLGGQLARAPVGGALRLRLRRHAHDFRRVDCRLAAASRQIARNRRNATFGESVAPCNDLPPTDFEPPRNLVIANVPSAASNTILRSPNTTGIQCLRSHAAFQFCSLFIGQS
jgi:hypothetical protein